MHEIDTYAHGEVLLENVWFARGHGLSGDLKKVCMFKLQQLSISRKNRRATPPLKFNSDFEHKTPFPTPLEQTSFKNGHGQVGYISVHFCVLFFLAVFQISSLPVSGESS